MGEVQSFANQVIENVERVIIGKRAAIELVAVRGREPILPDDIKYLVHVTLSHRLILRPEAELRGRNAKSILEDVLQNTPLNLDGVEK